MTGLGLDCRVNSEGGRKGQTTGARFEPHQLTSGWGEQGLGGSAESTIARKCWYRCTTREEVNRGVPHTLQIRLHSMGDRGIYKAQGQDHHSLEILGRMVG